MADHLKLTEYQERTVSDLACLGGNAFGAYISSEEIDQRLRNYYKMDEPARGELRADLMSWVHGELQAAVGAALKGWKVSETPPQKVPDYPAQFTHAPGQSWPGSACGLNTVKLGLSVDILRKTVDCPACRAGENF